MPGATRTAVYGGFKRYDNTKGGSFRSRTPRRLRRVQKRLHSVDGATQIFCPVEHCRNFEHGTALRDGRHVENTRNLKLRCPVLDIFVQNIIQDLARGFAITLEETLLRAAHLLGALAASAQGRAEDHVAKNSSAVPARVP